MSGFDDLPENTTDFNPQEPTQINAVAPAVAEITAEDDFDTTLEKMKIRDQILRYNVSFAKYLTAYEEKIIAMDSLELESLKRLFTEIKIAVSARTSGNMARRNYNAVITSVEYIAPMIGMNLRGLSAFLTEDEEVRECIEELNIKYDVMHHVPPEVRLIFLTANAALSINRENQKMQKIVNIMNEPVAQEHVEEFDDL